MKKNIQLAIIAAFVLSCFMGSRSYGQCNAPVINSFTPNTGFIGSTVTITGAFFDPTPANNQVFFGATQATILTSSFGVMTVTVPVGATTAPISVKNNCNLTAYSAVSFNGIFCPTPLTATSYSNNAFILSGVYGAYNMLSQDMDMDGRPDIVCGGLGNGITIARNTSTPGNLSFVAHNFAVGPRQQVVADFDGDGKRDIVLSNGGVYIMRNTSTPGIISFAATYTVPGGSGTYQCAAGDFNNDGKIDIVADNGTIQTFMNTSTGPGVISFTANTTIPGGTLCTGIQCVDVDGDGVTDILATQGNLNRAISLRNITPPGNSTFSFQAIEIWSTGGIYPYRCQIADFDKDGKIDLATVNFNSPVNTVNTAVLRNTSVPGDISFAPVVTRPGPQSNYRIGVGDVNGDGFPDIVTKSLAVNVFNVYRNTSSGPGNINFDPRFDYPAAAAEVSGIVIGDLDGDFVPDIATSGIGSSTIRFHRNTSSQVDNTAPTAICKNITVPLSPSGSVTVTAAMIDNGSSDACGIGSLLIDGEASVTFTCANVGPNNVILTVKDIAGNTATCNAVVTVAPAAIIVSGQTTVCQGQTVLLTANQGDTYQWQKDGVNIAGATNQTYTATETGDYTVTVTNAGGCSGTSSAVHVTVNNNPTVQVTPSGTTFLCPPGNNALLTASLSSIYQWKLNNVNIPGATQQTYTATIPGSYTVQVIDLFGCSATSDPVIVLANPAEIDITGNAVSIEDGDNTPSVVDATDFGTTFPSVPIVQTFTIHNTGISDLTVSTINISGIDAANFSLGGISLPATVPGVGGTVSFTVTFLGTAIQVYNAEITVNNNDCDEPVYNYDIRAEISCVPPTITCPATIFADNDPGSCGAIVNYGAGATATGIPSPVITYSHASGSFFPVGTTTVTATATSNCGTATCTFDVVVKDVEKPVIIAPDLFICYETSGLGCAVDLGGSATDNCLLISLTNDAPPCFPVGTTVVTWATADDHGNISTKTQAVTRNPEINITICAGPTLTIYSGIVSGFGPFGPQCVTLNSTATGGTPSYSYSWSPTDGLSDPNIPNPVACPTVTTVYTLTVKDSKECTRTLTVTVNVLPLSSLVCSGSGNNTKFTVCHVPPGNPPNPQTICISGNAVNAHLVTGSIGHQNCYLGPCRVEQLCFSTIPGAVPLVSRLVNEASDDGGQIIMDGLNVKVYPNPSTGDFTIRVSSDKSETIRVRVLDTKGVVRSTGVLNLESNSLRVGEKFPPGTYIAEVVQGNSRQIVKMVKLK